MNINSLVGCFQFAVISTYGSYLWKVVQGKNSDEPVKKVAEAHCAGREWRLALVIVVFIYKDKKAMFFLNIKERFPVSFSEWGMQLIQSGCNYSFNLNLKLNNMTKNPEQFFWVNALLKIFNAQSSSCDAAASIQHCLFYSKGIYSKPKIYKPQL